MLEFQELYVKYNKEIYCFILKRVNRNSAHAEELTQETFYQVYLSLSKFRGESDLRTWIYGIAKKVCYKFFRKNPSDLHIPYSEETASCTDQASSEKTLTQLMEIKELTDLIGKEIVKLKKKYRDVLICRLYLEMSFREISKTLRISENSSKVIHYRGLKMLRKRLEDLQNDT